MIHTDIYKYEVAQMVALTLRVQAYDTRVTCRMTCNHDHSLKSLCVCIVTLFSLFDVVFVVRMWPTSAGAPPRPP